MCPKFIYFQEQLNIFFKPEKITFLNLSKPTETPTSPCLLSHILTNPSWSPITETLVFKLAWLYNRELWHLSPERNILEEIRDNKIVRFVWKVWFHVAQVNTLMVIIGNTYFTIHWQLSASGWKLRSLQLLITFLIRIIIGVKTPYYHYQ
jgi:hypothetical protein